MGEPKGNDLRHPQLLAHVKDNVVVDMDHPAGVLVQQDVIQVAVTQAQQVPHLSPPQHMGCIMRLVPWGLCCGIVLRGLCCGGYAVRVVPWGLCGGGCAMGVVQGCAVGVGLHCPVLGGRLCS